MGKLDGKVALVTGSGRGIGQAIALKLASEGARIVVNDLDADPAHETVELLKKSGADAIRLLYGKTADIAAAKAAGVRLGIGSDWSPSGSKNLLGELKVARLATMDCGSEKVGTGLSGSSL